MPRKDEYGVSSDEIPLKTRVQLRKQRERRSALAAARLKEMEVSDQAAANERARAANKAIISHAKKSLETAAEQSTKQKAAAEAREQEQAALWVRSRAAQAGGQRFSLPPLQRWEAPRSFEPPPLISAGMRITIPSMKHWVEDHTRQISVPIDNRAGDAANHGSSTSSLLSKKALVMMDRASQPPKVDSTMPRVAERSGPRTSKGLEPYRKSLVGILVSPRPTALQPQPPKRGSDAMVLLSPRYGEAATSQLGWYPPYEPRSKTPLWALVPEVGL